MWLVSDPHIIARLHAGEGGLYLWVANPTKKARTVKIQIDPRWGSVTVLHSLWGNAANITGDGRCNDGRTKGCKCPGTEIKM